MYCIKPEGKYILQGLICHRTHTHARALLLFQGLLVSSKFVFNVPPTAKAIMRHGYSFGPRPVGWRSQGLSLRYLGTRRVVNHYTEAAPQAPLRCREVNDLLAVQLRWNDLQLDQTWWWLSSICWVSCACFHSKFWARSAYRSFGWLALHTVCL